MPPDQVLTPTTLTLALPRFAQIEPIGRCNLACRMCTVNERGDAVGEMSLSQFRSLLDQMPQLQELHLQGLGEPMLHPHFFDMVSLAAGRGIKVSANTNLTLLTPARAQRCVDSGLASLSVSLDGATAPVYEAIRRKASFAKVVRNLGRLADARDAAGSSMEVRGVMVLMRGNMAELPALLHLLHQHRIDTLLVQRLSNDLRQPDLPGRYIPIRDYVDDAELRTADLPQAHAVFEEARQLAARLGMRLHLPRLPALPSAAASPEASAATQTRNATPPPAATPRGHCTWPWDQLYVTASGELLPCCMVATADRASFGNVFHPGVAQEANDGRAASALLLERWHGARAQSFRQALGEDAPPAVCRSCALYHGAF